MSPFSAAPGPGPVAARRRPVGSLSGSPLRWGVLAAVVLVALAADRLASGWLNAYQLHVLCITGIAVIMAASLNLVNGITGQFSLGHAGFMAVGAYAGAALTVKWGQPWAIYLGHGTPQPVAAAASFVLALLVAGLAAAGVGVVVGMPAARLRGDYLAIATLGFGEVVRELLLNAEAVGGRTGFGGIPQSTSLAWVLALAALTIIVLRNILCSTHGRALLAVREDESAAMAQGIDVARYKVGAFAVSAFFAGLAGCLFAHRFCFIHPDNFGALQSIEIVTTVVLGGMGSITGSVAAALVLGPLPEVLKLAADWAERASAATGAGATAGPSALLAAGLELKAHPEYLWIVYSLLLVGMMLLRPQGLMGDREVSLGMLRRLLPRPGGGEVGDGR